MSLTQSPTTRGAVLKGLKSLCLGLLDVRPALQPRSGPGSTTVELSGVGLNLVEPGLRLHNTLIIFSLKKLVTIG